MKYYGTVMGHVDNDFYGVTNGGGGGWKEGEKEETLPLFLLTLTHPSARAERDFCMRYVRPTTQKKKNCDLLFSNLHQDCFELARVATHSVVGSLTRNANGLLGELRQPIGINSGNVAGLTFGRSLGSQSECTCDLSSLEIFWSRRVSPHYDESTHALPDCEWDKSLWPTVAMPRPRVGVTTRARISRKRDGFQKCVFFSFLVRIGR